MHLKELWSYSSLGKIARNLFFCGSLCCFSVHAGQVNAQSGDFLSQLAEQAGQERPGNTGGQVSQDTSSSSSRQQSEGVLSRGFEALLGGGGNPLAGGAASNLPMPQASSNPGFNLPQANTGQRGGASAVANQDPRIALQQSFGGGSAPQNKLSREELEARIREEAFNAAITGLLPLNPDEIRKLLQRFDETQQAVEVPIYPYPEPDVAVQTVSLDPGSKPPVIKVGVGHVTTVNLLDITGSPWAIQDMTWAGDFEIVQPEAGGNIMRITPLSEYAYGNISIRMVELQTPLIFTMKTARDKIHYRFDAKIPEYGPEATTPLIQGGVTIAAGGDQSLGAVLDGVPPSAAEKLNVSGVDGRTTAFKIGDRTYVRTPLTLLSPGWLSSASSADGMRVYALNNAPVLLLSDRGDVVRARLTSAESDGE